MGRPKGSTLEATASKPKTCGTSISKFASLTHLSLTAMIGNSQGSSPMRKPADIGKAAKSTRSGLPHSARRSTMSKKQIADSDDINMGSDADDLLSEPLVRDTLDEGLENSNVSEDEGWASGLARKRRPTQRQETKTLLKEVAIPTSRVSGSRGRIGRVLASQSPSSIGSALSTSRDRSIEYDTPATSAAVTPAESLSKSSLSKPLGNHVSRTLANTRTMANTKGKRKREDVDELVEADALLAQALQEEEYGEKMPQRGRPKKTLRSLVDDSDGDSILSDAPQEDPDEVDMPKTKRTRKNSRPSLPTRAARESAKQSITAKASREVLDTDDSDDISFTYSDADFDSLEEIDDDEDILLPAPSTAAAATTAPTNNPGNPSPVRRRARRQDRQRGNNWRERMQRGMDSRVALSLAV